MTVRPISRRRRDTENAVATEYGYGMNGHAVEARSILKQPDRHSRSDGSSAIRANIVNLQDHDPYHSERKHRHSDSISGSHSYRREDLGEVRGHVVNLLDHGASHSEERRTRRRHRRSESAHRQSAGEVRGYTVNMLDHDHDETDRRAAKSSRSKSRRRDAADATQTTIIERRKSTRTKPIRLEDGTESRHRDHRSRY
jgi:hypothetical protein